MQTNSRMINTSTNKSIKNIHIKPNPKCATTQPCVRQCKEQQTNLYRPRQRVLNNRKMQNAQLRHLGERQQALAGISCPQFVLFTLFQNVPKLKTKSRVKGPEKEHNAVGVLPCTNQRGRIGGNQNALSNCNWMHNVSSNDNKNLKTIIFQCWSVLGRSSKCFNRTSVIHFSPLTNPLRRHVSFECSQQCWQECLLHFFYSNQ